MKPVTTDTERGLRNLWVKLLHTPETAVGATEKFFQLGGDSVTATELITAVRNEGLSLTVLDVFKSPFLKDMARAMTKFEGFSDEEPTPPFSMLPTYTKREDLVEKVAEELGIMTDQIEDNYPCTAMQEALVAATSHRPRAYTYQAVYDLSTLCEADNTRWRSAWEALVARHCILRTRFAMMQDVGALQVVLRSDIPLNWHSHHSLQQYLKARSRSTNTLWSRIEQTGHC